MRKGKDWKWIIAALLLTTTTRTACGAAERPLSSDTGKASATLPLMVEHNDSDGSFVVKGGSCFSIVLDNDLDSDSCAIGYPVTARLEAPITIGNSVLAREGARIIGHVTLVDAARSGLQADIPGKHWLNAQGAIGVEFDEIIRHDDQRFALDAMPCPDTRVSFSPLALDVEADPAKIRIPVIADKRGDLVVDFHAKRNALLRLAIEGGSIAAGPLGLAIGPVTSGIAGAVSPAYAFGHPADMTGIREHEKGFVMGAVRGLPVAGLLTDAAERGRNVSLRSGDSLVVRLVSDLKIGKEYQ